MKRNTINETPQTETTENLFSEEITNNVLDFSTTLKELRKTVDPNLIRQRAGRRDRDGNVHMVEYVEWHTVADVLDDNAPNWAHTVKDIRSIGDIVTVTVAITIDGVTREGIGTGKAISETGIKKAEHDALKRAAVKFGIARELYKKEFDAIEQTDEPQAFEPKAISDPIAKSLGDMVTGKQLGMIRAIAREANIDAEAECSQMMRCGIDELSKRAASDLIEHLQNLQRNTVTPMRRVG
ncbi:MAG TPA: Rad52/Rad22 family DNA repair protein [Pyrinomonadaceae bacterium]|nr:Rad52/Rad22 family DNA repair protein [Pyrinomonadaceae bacterium]